MIQSLIISLQCDDVFKAPLFDLTHFLVAETPLKMMKNDFYFMLKALFVLKIFKFLSLIFLHVGKRFDKKAKINGTTW